MASLDILYIILGVCVVIVTVTFVWLAADLRKLIRSLRRSAEDTEAVTKEIKEKVLLVSEAMDRLGQAAANVMGLIEDSVEMIKEKRDQIVGSISLLTGAGKFIKGKSKVKSQKSQPKADRPLDEKVQGKSEKVKQETEETEETEAGEAPEEKQTEKKAEEEEGEKKLDELAKK